MTYPAVGAIAPDFTLDTDAGTPLKLSSLRGRPVVLFFYPKDDTPGCTVESCEFRDAMPRFQGLKAEVLGISPDDVKSHVKFRKKFDLPYSLLADVGHKVADAYGVWQEKSMMGRKYMGIVRSHFVVDESGRLADVQVKVSPTDSVEKAVATLA